MCKCAKEMNKYVCTDKEKYVHRKVNYIRPKWLRILSQSVCSLEHLPIGAVEFINRNSAWNTKFLSYKKGLIIS